MAGERRRPLRRKWARGNLKKKKRLKNLRAGGKHWWGVKDARIFGGGGAKAENLFFKWGCKQCSMFSGKACSMMCLWEGVVGGKKEKGGKLGGNNRRDGRRARDIVTPGRRCGRSFLGGPGEGTLLKKKKGEGKRYIHDVKKGKKQQRSAVTKWRQECGKEKKGPDVQRHKRRQSDTTNPAGSRAGAWGKKKRMEKRCRVGGEIREGGVSIT